MSLSYVRKRYNLLCAPSKDSDQPVLQRSLIRVFARRPLGNRGPNNSSYWQRRLWSDCMDAHADLTLHQADTTGCTFRCSPARNVNKDTNVHFTCVLFLLWQKTTGTTLSITKTQISPETRPECHSKFSLIVYNWPNAMANKHVT